MADRVERVSAFEGYERWAETYDQTANPVVAMDSRRALPVLSVEPGEIVLDAGCGTGRNLGGIIESGARAIGIDFSPAMLRVAHRQHPSAALVLADLRARLPFADSSIDAVLCSLVGEHIADLYALFGELRRVIKPGGRMVFSVYHPTMAADGIEANFEQDGIEYRLGAFDYDLDDYLDAVSSADFPQVMYREFRGDQALADEVPTGGRYLGKPVLLVIAALAD
jgi:SAM-dependent methyltransferase